MRDRIIPRLSLLFAVLIIAVSVPAFPQAPLDPQSLVGEWRGSWKASHGHAKGDYSLIIERIDGQQVYGRVKMPESKKAEFRLVGRLEGNRLTFGEKGATELFIDGRRMSGASRGTIGRDITLWKRE